MQDFGIFEAKNQLSALIELVARGEEVMITRHGKPVAKLVSFDFSPTGREPSRRPENWARSPRVSPWAMG